MHSLLVSEEATLDVADAIAYYDTKNTGLSKRFRKEITQRFKIF